jgi:hypothetical protein
MAIVTVSGSSLSSELQELLLADNIVPGSDISYQLCKTIYLYHPLGQKMSESPIAMAQFKPRDITVTDGPEEMCKKAFVEEWKAINADKYIFNIAKLARIYGVASIACLSREVAPEKPLDFKDVAEKDIAFNSFDPLNTAGSLVLNQNPLALDFLKSRDIAVGSQFIHRSRTVTLMNEDPIYLGWTSSAFGYVGRSVYQRALFPLKSFIQTMLTDDMISTKAGVIVAKMEQPGSIIDNLMGLFYQKKRQVVKDARNYGVVGVGTNDTIESLNLQNIDGAASMARKNILENIAVAADMPAKLLNAETFAEGFGEGSEDAKNVARYIDRVRTWMQPLYDYFDKIVMFRAWNPEWYETVQEQFPEFKSIDHQTAFWRFRNSFTAEWPSLLTEPESERAKADDVKLKAVIAMLEVLLPEVDPENKATLVAWAADNFNELKSLFGNPLELDYEALESYDPTPEQLTDEPGEAPPFSARDSDRALVDNVKRLLISARKKKHASV